MDISAFQHINIRMGTRGKRPLRNLTPTDKVRAIQRIHNGETKASVSRDIGVPESTLRGWCKNEQKLRFMCRQLASDHINLSVLENPPEKRTKYDSQIIAPKFETFSTCKNAGFNRLPFQLMDFANNSNTIFEKIALNDFINRSANQELHKDDNEKHNLIKETQPNSSECLQGNMMQKLNLLSLINPNLSFTTAKDNQNGEKCSSNSKVILKTPNEEVQGKISSNNGFSTLTVKNWAKDPAEVVTSIDSINKNDKNNNGLFNRNRFLPVCGSTENGLFPSIFSLGHPQFPIIEPEFSKPDECSSGLLDWYKMFNASLNFLALAAATAALQPSTSSTLEDVNFHKPVEQRLPEQGVEIFQQLHKKFFSSEISLSLNDTSNGSFTESEPEDLSVRSSSKISSPPNSRSQSPAKSSISSYLQSDGE